MSQITSTVTAKVRSLKGELRGIYKLKKKGNSITFFKDDKLLVAVAGTVPITLHSIPVEMMDIMDVLKNHLSAVGV